MWKWAWLKSYEPFGQRSKLPKQASAALLTHELNITLTPMVWIDCVFDPLWLGSNLTSLRPRGEVANTVQLLRSLHVQKFFTTLIPMAWINCGLDLLWFEYWFSWLLN